MADRPNILFFHVDNLGFGELSCYSGGPFRGRGPGGSTPSPGGVPADQLLRPRLSAPPPGRRC